MTRIALHVLKKLGSNTHKCIDIVYTIEYNHLMKFEWDDDKNVANFHKHDVWFEEAQTIKEEEKQYEEGI